MVIPLSPIQIADLAEFIKYPRHANLSDPGTRKTAVMNVFAEYMWRKKKSRTLLLNPISLSDQNRKSFFKFTEFSEDDVIIVEGTPERRIKKMQSDAKVFIGSFNFFVPDKTGKSDYERLKFFHPDLDYLAVDEIHMGFRSMTAARTLHFINAMNHPKLSCKHFHPITGTPVDGNLGTIYPWLHIIEPRYYYNYEVFKKEHGVEDEWGRIYKWINTDKVKKILEKHSVRHTFEEVHGPEAIVIEQQPVSMNKQHDKIYAEYENKQVLVYEDEIKEASGQAEAVLRLRQICNAPEELGFEINVLEKDERLKILMGDAIEAKKPFIIFAASHPEQHRLAKLATKEGALVGLINGSVSVNNRRKISEAFQQGLLNGVVASPATVGVGYDWDHVDTIIFYSMDYKDSSFVQGYRRAVRGKRSHPVLVYILYYEKTVEEDILAIMEGKMETANATDATRKIFELRFRKRKKNT